MSLEVLEQRMDGWGVTLAPPKRRYCGSVKACLSQVGTLGQPLRTFLFDVSSLPRSLQLRIRDPEKYGWKPRELLSLVVQLYVNLHLG